MAITFERLQELLRAEGLKYFIDPTGCRVMLSGTGLSGTYQFGIALESEGQFLQFRSLHLLRCPLDHPNLKAVLEVIAHVNLQFRYVKTAWDASDGEIVMYGDSWIADNTLTERQFHTLFGNFVTALDLHSPRIRKVIETGHDAGSTRPEDVLAGLAGALPKELRDLLEKLKEGETPPRPALPGEIKEL